MNLHTAREIAHQVTKMAEAVTVYYAHFPHDYQLDESSPAKAWKLYQKFMNRQARVAMLLDRDAVSTPFTRWERWWERCDVMRIALVNELAHEAMRLVERAAYLQAIGAELRHEDSLRTIQEGIAGMLHPVTRQQALSHVVAEAQHDV